MILPFSTQLNGKPTYFVEKIWSSLYELYKEDEKYFVPNLYYACLDRGFQNMYPHKPKLHTIREDKNDRWHAGKMIDFFINCRQKDMFRFAPVMPVVSTQEVFMTYAFNDVIQISIDGRELFGHEREDFAINDGFDNWYDFFDYFYPKIKANPKEFFKGKIIHWTDLRY